MPTTLVSESVWTETVERDGEEAEVTRRQYKTTIPKKLAENYAIDGDTELEWTFGSAKNKLEIEVLNGD